MLTLKNIFRGIFDFIKFNFFTINKIKYTNKGSEYLIKDKIITIHNFKIPGNYKISATSDGKEFNVISEILFDETIVTGLPMKPKFFNLNNLTVNVEDYKGHIKSKTFLKDEKISFDFLIEEECEEFYD
uniref:Uncharacterized protein n=1 Tax=viral metagenome TaxID=1070528 RepID=A0A6C0AER8_9ZZZZ